MASASDPTIAAENPFDRVTTLAAALFGAPISAVSLLQGDCYALTSAKGTIRTHGHVDDSFSKHVLALGPHAVLVIEDLSVDPRTESNPYVTGGPMARFYAGAAITAADGRSLGTVAVADTIVRERPADEALESLKMLARIAGDICEQLELARRQKEQLETLQLAEAMAGVGHWRYDARTGVINWSDEVFRIHGLEPGSIDPTLESLGPRYHAEDRDRVGALIDRALVTGEGYDTRLRLYRNGEERVTRTYSRVERDEDGNALALFGVFQDITDAVRAEREQAELVETLKLAEDLAGIGCWKLDVETGQVRWSDQVYRIHGVTPQTFDPSLDDAVGFYHPDDQQAVRDWCAEAIESGSAGEFKLRLIRSDGEERIVESQCRPERGEDGRTRALFGVFQDVTEVVRSHERIAASEARYRLIADNATDVIATYGMDGLFRYMSPAIEGPMGYRPEELVGRPFSDFMHPDDVKRVQKAFADYARAGPDAAPPRVPYRGIRKDGTLVWLEAHPKLIRDATGAPAEFQDVVRDITATKALEEELIAARDVAEAAAQAKSEFLANMSHELRTPLTSVIGFSGLLQSSDTLPEAERRYADRIATASEALLSVINDILDYSKLEADAVGLDPLPFDPAAMARGAAAMIEGQCEAKGLTLRIEIAPDVPFAVMGDQGRLRQVALNFLSNAVKFTGSGEIGLGVSRAGDRLRVEVSDSGIGIAPEKIDALFERFTQADASTTRVYGGTGLGLAISRRLIELMHGEIGAHSRSGEGSTFWFEVPLIEADGGPTAISEIVSALPVGLRVLMADDASANRELVRVLLGAWDVDIDTVCDGAEAVQAMVARAYDLVLMDVHMPVMDGMDATRAIRAMTTAAAATPILALTANVQPEQVEACRRAGMDGHVGKPIQVATLIEEMTRALAARPSAGARVAA